MIVPLFVVLGDLNFWRLGRFSGGGQKTPLGQAFETLESVIDEDPVLIGGRCARCSRASLDVIVVVIGCCCTAGGVTVGGYRQFQVDVGKLVKIGCVVNGFDMHGNGRRSLPDVVPINSGITEKLQGFDLFQRLDASVRIWAKSVTQSKWTTYCVC